MRNRDVAWLHSRINVFDCRPIPGGDAGGATPVPIPNTEVKPSWADGTAWATAWESRSLPGLFSAPGSKYDPGVAVSALNCVDLPHARMLPSSGGGPRDPDRLVGHRGPRRLRGPGDGSRAADGQRL